MATFLEEMKFLSLNPEGASTSEGVIGLTVYFLKNE